MKQIDLAIIDDDDAVRDSLSALLTVSGYSSQSFDSAIDFLRSDLKPKVVVLDLYMPAMSGLELVDRLRSSGDMTPVILISGEFKESDYRQAKSLNVDKFLEKPFTDEDLLKALEEIGTFPSSC
ncbi:response regulator [Hyphococcus formosus]|uniref:response regulator transcription factor n=1 Tax=Hyphococcus formosus TaxID=3143534 RepID=UPI00398AD490